MQVLDALTLGHLSRELDVKLADGKVQKIQQSSYHEVLIQFWVGGEARYQKLFISIRPAFPFCALVEGVPELAFPKQPLNFCLLLRKYLMGARVEQVSALPFERVINLAFQTFNELGEPQRLLLSLELMGKQSNLLLIDRDTDLLVGCAHGVSAKMSRFREVAVGLPYEPPPCPDKPLLSELSQASFVAQLQHAQAAGQSSGESPAKVLTQHFRGMSQAVLAQVIALSTTPADAFDRFHQLIKGQDLVPCMANDGQGFSLLNMAALQPECWRPFPTINQLVATYGLGHWQRLFTQQKRQQLSQQWEQWSRRLAKQQALLVDRDDELEAETFKACGDALTRVLFLPTSPSISFDQDGLGHLSLTHPVSGQPLDVTIPTGVSLSDAAQRYYKQFKKSQRRRALVEAQRSQMQADQALLADIQVALSHAQTMTDLALVEADLVDFVAKGPLGWRKTEGGDVEHTEHSAETRQSQGPRKPVSKQKQHSKRGSKPTKSVLAAPCEQFVSSDGFVVWLGKSQLQNEHLLGKVAQPHDLWFHAHQLPGGHVVVKTNKQKVPDQTLLEAAQLAAYHSQARNSTKVNVVYTAVKYVRKVPSGHAGLVTYTHEHELTVSPALEGLQKPHDTPDLG